MTESRREGRGLRWDELVLPIIYALGGGVGVATGLVTPGTSGAQSVVWLPPGVALAMALSGSRRRWLVIGVGASLLGVAHSLVEAPGLASGPRALLGAVFGVSSALQAELAARAVRRWAGGTILLDRPRSVAAYAICCVSASLVTPTLGSAAFWGLGLRSVETLAFDWGLWWLVETISSLLVAPAILPWLAHPRRLWEPRRVRVGAPMLLALVALAAWDHRATRAELERKRSELELAADEATRGLRRELDDTLELARTLADFAQARGALDERELDALTTSLHGRHEQIANVTWLRGGQSAGLSTLIDHTVRGRASIVASPMAAVDLDTGRAQVLVAAPIEVGGEILGHVLCTADVALRGRPLRPGSRALRYRLAGQAAAERGELGPGLVSRAFDGGGKRWSLEVYTAPDYFRQPRSAVDLAIVVAGVALASFLGGLLLVSTGRSARLAAQVASRSERLALANRELRDEIEAHQQVKRALQESELRWQFALEEAGEGMWDLNLATDSLFWSPRLHAVLGYEPGEIVPSFETWARMVHPDDLLAVQLSFDRHLRGEVASFQAELRMRRRDGGWVWFETRAKVVARDPEGRAIRMIGTQVNVSTRKLAEQRLEAHRQELEAQVRERTGQLELAKTAAEDASRAKSVFLANMSHELRTPMHAILAFANLGIEREPEGRGRQFFVRIVESANRLLPVLNDLLDLSRLEAGSIPVDLSACDLRRLVLEAGAALEPFLLQKQLSLHVQQASQGDAPLAMVDANRMTQVFQNVLVNAVRFSAEGASIEVAFEDASLSCASGQRAPAMAISISDRGIGIPDSELERIFDSFTQSSKTASKAGGTGLGLAICRQLLALHGGTIVARNNQGPGATFVITVPLRPLKRNQAA